MEGFFPEGRWMTLILYFFAKSGDWNLRTFLGWPPVNRKSSRQMRGKEQKIKSFNDDYSSITFGTVVLGFWHSCHHIDNCCHNCVPQVSNIGIGHFEKSEIESN